MSGPDFLFDYAEPSVEDRDAVWQLAQEADSSAVYLLWCVDYAESSLIARVDGRAVGCIVGRRLMSGPDELVIVAISVASAYAGSRLRELLMFNLIQRMRLRHRIRFVQIAEETRDHAVSSAFHVVARWLDSQADPVAVGRIGPLDPDLGQRTDEPFLTK